MRWNSKLQKEKKSDEFCGGAVEEGAERQTRLALV
jgi:hypothetical protein